jgi:hypothetical protein
MFKAGSRQIQGQDRHRLDSGSSVPGIDCTAKFRTQSVSAILNSYSACNGPAGRSSGARLFNFLKMRERSRNVEDLLELD